MSINLSDTPYGIETCVCGNCNWCGDESQLKAVKDLEQRVAPGEVMPAGECPECGALAHVVTEMSRAVDLIEPMFLILRDVLESTKDEKIKSRIKTVFSNIFEDGGFSRHQFNLLAGQGKIENYMNDVGGEIFDNLSEEESQYIFIEVKRGHREDAIRNVIQDRIRG